MPGKESVWLHERSWKEVADHLLRDDVLLIPVGATEQHGHHAPLLLDTGWAVSVCEATAKLAGCLVAPPIHYGWSHGHMAYPGTLGLRAETLAAVVVDVAECAVRHGFKRIILVNGNRVANLPPLEIAAAKLRMGTGAVVAVVDCGLVARSEVAALCEGGPGTLAHAGESETSMVMAFFPDLVDPELMPGGFAPPPPASLRTGHLAIDPRHDGNSFGLPHTPEEYRARTGARHGVVGDEGLASAEKGRAMVEAIAKNAAEVVRRVRGTAADAIAVPGVVV
jgi:creatinine amidohydrolase